MINIIVRLRYCAHSTGCNINSECRLSVPCTLVRGWKWIYVRLNNQVQFSNANLGPVGVVINPEGVRRTYAEICYNQAWCKFKV